VVERLSLKRSHRTIDSHIAGIAIALAAVALFSALVCANSIAQTTPRKITREEAQNLAVDALDPASRQLPGLTLEKYKEEHFPDFFAFEAIWDNPDPDGSTVVDDLAIDPQTADVWRRGACRIQTPALAKSQAALRKRIGLSDAEYQKLRRPGPTC
jgi:hypothetical protein